MRLLFLTSPPLRGRDVYEVQLHLRRLGFAPGPLDGIYGPATAAAVRRLQRAAGIRVDGIVGPQTIEHLNAPAIEPKPHLPGREPPGFLAMRWLLARAGEKEDPPDSNNCPVTREFGLGRVPWCMEAVSLAFKHGANLILGDQAPHPWGFWSGRGFAYVPAFEAWAKTRGFWIGRTTPEPGDVACYGFGGLVAVHTGIVVKAHANGSFEAVEGNTGIGNDANGGEIMLRHRYLTQVIGFARVTHTKP